MAEITTLSKVWVVMMHYDDGNDQSKRIRSGITYDSILPIEDKVYSTKEKAAAALNTYLDTDRCISCLSHHGVGVGCDNYKRVIDKNVTKPTSSGDVFYEYVITVNRSGTIGNQYYYVKSIDVD